MSNLEHEIMAWVGTQPGNGVHISRRTDGRYDVALSAPEGDREATGPTLLAALHGARNAVLTPL